MKSFLISIGELLIMEMNDIVDIKYNDDTMNILLATGEQYYLNLKAAS